MVDLISAGKEKTIQNPAQRRCLRKTFFNRHLGLVGADVKVKGQRVGQLDLGAQNIWALHMTMFLFVSPLRFLSNGRAAVW